MIDQKKLAKVQQEVKRVVDEFLKKTETEALKYTKVGYNIRNGACVFYIRIALSKPMKFTTIQQLVDRVNNVLKVREWKIYAPCANVIRLDAYVEEV